MTTKTNRKRITIPNVSSFKTLDTDRETITSLSTKLRTANAEIEKIKAELSDLEQRVYALESF